MRRFLPIPAIVAGLFSLGCISCASPAQKAGYETFLDNIAEDCKPLIIGSDNIGVALASNGVAGAGPYSYHHFLKQTLALYYGQIPPATYRTFLTAYVGAGTYNDRSFDCIVAHLPSGLSP